MDDYSRSLMEHSTEVAENDISWLDRLIATEHKRSLDNAQIGEQT